MVLHEGLEENLPNTSLENSNCLPQVQGWCLSRLAQGWYCHLVPFFMNLLQCLITHQTKLDFFELWNGSLCIGREKFPVSHAIISNLSSALPSFIQLDDSIRFISESSLQNLPFQLFSSLKSPHSWACGGMIIHICALCMHNSNSKIVFLAIKVSSFT